MNLWLALSCAVSGVVISPFLTRITRGSIRRRTPEGVALRSVDARLVAGATATGFAATALQFGPHVVLAAYLFLVALLVVLSFVDLATKKLPRDLVRVALVGGILLLVPIAVITGEPQRLWWAALGAVGSFVVLAALHFVARGGFGFGDVRLGAMLGWYLAWQGLRYVPAGLFLAFVLSAVTGVTLMALGRLGRRTAIPFGPFLAIGAVLALVGPSVVAGA